MAENNLLTRYKADNSDFVKKTKDAQRTLDQFGLKGTEVGSKISKITDALNINVGALSKLAVGLGAAGAALKVAGDAFKQNEVIMDEFNRNIEAAKGVYDGFLNALNTGDISGFLSNINNIVKAARDAYDAMDDLGTFNAFNQINAEGNRANLSEALANFKSGKGSAKSITSAADAVKEDLRQRQKYEQNAYETAINALAEKRGVNAEMLKEALSGKYGAYQTLKNTKMTATETVYYSGGMFGGGGSYQKAVAANEQEKLGEMLRKLTDDELQSLQAVGAQAARTGREIADVDKQVAKYMKEGPGGGGGGGDKGLKPAAGSMDEIKQQIVSLNKDLSAAVTDEARANIRAMIAEAEERLKGMQAATKGSGIDLTMTNNISAPTSGISNAAANLDTSNVQKAAADWKKYQDSLRLANEENQKAYSAIGAIGQALKGIDNVGARVMGIIAEAIANIALTFSKSLAGTVTPWDWIAGAAAGTATMISTISAIKSATAGNYANGGIVPGNNFSGDNMIAHVNSGEMIITRENQQQLFRMLNGGGNYYSQSGGEIRVRIENNQLVGTLRNASARAAYHA